MDASLSTEFCTRGHFWPGKGEIKSIFERGRWSNQHGHGFCIALNLRWLCFSLEVYFSDPQEKKLNGVAPLTVPYEGIPTEDGGPHV